MVIEAVGTPAAFELCTTLVRPGGRVANIGVHGRPATLHLEDLWIRNITITTGLFRGLTRAAATRFSFLLSVPAIAGAVVMELPKLIKMHKAGGLDLPLSTLAVSILVSGVAGYFVIAFLLRYLQTHTLKVFIVYRLLFGMIVLVWAFLQAGLR